MNEINITSGLLMFGRGANHRAFEARLSPKCLGSRPAKYNLLVRDADRLRVSFFKCTRFNCTRQGRLRSNRDLEFLFCLQARPVDLILRRHFSNCIDVQHVGAFG